MVKYFFSTCVLSQNQIVILVFKNITNSTCGYEINSLDTFVRIPLVFLTECHVTPYTWHGTCGFKAPCGVVLGFLGATSD
jgi:hypothetical protein